VIGTLEVLERRKTQYDVSEEYHESSLFEVNYLQQNGRETNWLLCFSSATTVHFADLKTSLLASTYFFLSISNFLPL
jgi:hypothetical protein